MCYIFISGLFDLMTSNIAIRSGIIFTKIEIGQR